MGVATTTTVLWSQTDTHVRVTFQRGPDAAGDDEDPPRIEARRIGAGGRVVELHADVEPEHSVVQQPAARRTVLLLSKERKGRDFWWPRLTRDAGRCGWIGCDWTTWTYVDEEDDQFWDDRDGVFRRPEWPGPDDDDDDGGGAS